jgi:hypothetical protein
VRGDSFAYIKSLEECKVGILENLISGFAVKNKGDQGMRVFMSGDKPHGEFRYPAEQLNSG